MSLTVCMIARNEQANLARSLPSVRDVADQIVVLDTGSDDATAEVAAGHGAEVGRFAWCEDFAAARNAAIDRAGCDWILWLDADEAVAASSCAALRRAIGRDDVLAYLLDRHDLTSNDPDAPYTRMWQARLFRRDANLRFVGRCHPHFDPPLEQAAATTGLSVEPTDIVLAHWGYVDAQVSRDKLRRGRRLLELELADRPGQLYYLVELFRTQMQLEEPEARDTLVRAMQAWGGQVNEARPPNRYAALLLETLLQLPGEALVGPWTPGLARKLAERWFGDSPPLVWLLAQQDFQAGRFADAAARLERLVNMGTTRRYDMTCSFDPRIIGADALQNLGVCRVKQAKLDQARRVFEQLRQDPARREAAEANLAVVRDLLQQHGGARKPAGRSSTRRSKRRR